MAATHPGAGRRPKTRAVATILRRYPTEIEADLLRYYGKDIGEWWREEMTSRRLLALIEHLPGDSAFKKATLTGDRWPEWVHVLAYAADQITMARREQQGPDSTWEPKPLPRPNDADHKEAARAASRAVHDVIFASIAP